MLHTLRYISKSWKPDGLVSRDQCCDISTDSQVYIVVVMIYSDCFVGSLTYRNVKICMFYRVGKSLDWSLEINVMIYLFVGIFLSL